MRKRQVDQQSSKASFYAFTWFDAVDHLSITALVFIKSCDLKNSWTYSRRFKHTPGVRCTYEPGCIIIGVIHIDNDTNKIPLYWNVLVPNLQRKNFNSQTNGGGRKKNKRQNMRALEALFIQQFFNTFIFT